MILGDRDIKYYLEKGWIVINPLRDDSIRENGVDLRVGGEIMRFADIFVPVSIDNNAPIYQKEEGEEFVIYPYEHVLMVTEEYIKLPNDIIGLVNLRSTFARLGLFIPPTIVDAGFEGQLTIEVIGSQIPIKIKKGQRFLHLIFAKTLTPVEHPYNGKYQKQRGVRGFY
jgi:dCTP deaminase